MTWEGRNLKMVVSSAGSIFAYTYNDQGLRLSKLAYSHIYYYTWDGDTLISQKWSNNLFVFLYDENGSPIGLQYRTADMDEGDFYTFFFEKNLQGDIIAMYADDGFLLGTYTYDAWGNCTATMGTDLFEWEQTAFQYNPFRYRGYYYDTETGLYYLQSRYYDPNTGRFLNADGYVNANGDLLGFNMYAYCGNNPVMYVDPTGEVPWLIIIAAVLLFTPVGGMAAQAATTTVSYIGAAVASIWDEEVRADMNAICWYPFNTDENAAVNSEKVSFYKGAPVFRTNLDRSGSYYGIFLRRGADSEELKHERGHNTQAMLMGIVNYGLMIGLPSAFEWSDRPYYDRPWEVTADVFGGVSMGTQSRDNINRGYWYLATSSLFGIAGYLFLPGEYQ